MNSERNPHLLNDPSGGGGCVIGSSTPIHGYGSPPGGGGGGVSDMAVGTPCPVPTPPWVKPPSNNGNSGMMTPESDVSSCSSPASTSYGASSQQNFPQAQQQNQHLLQQHRSFYGASGNNFNNSNTGGSGYCTNNNNSNAISSSTNSNSGMFYDSSGEVMDQSQYYHQHHHQQHQQHHFQQQFQNNMQHLQQKSGSSNNSPNLIDSNNLTGECVDHGGGNFYGFYNSNSGQYTEYHHSQQQQHQHHHPHHHQHHNHHQESFSVSGDVTGGGNNARMNQFYHNHHHRQDNTGANYFNTSGATQSYPNSAGGTSTPPTRYGSSMVFPQNHNYAMHQNHVHMQGQVPIRRNSIESFSSEPGTEAMHSSYASRFGGSCPNPTGMNNMGTMHHMHNPGQHQFPPTTGETGAGMVKREQCSSMTSRSSPSMNPMTPNAGCWSPHPPSGGYFPSSSPNNSCSSSGGSPNPCSSSNNANTNTNRTTNYINPSYNSQSGCGGGESANCASNFYHHQPVPTTQFKSCAYEQSQQHHDIKEGISSLKAASAVKHRSLSLSMPLPSYMENGRDNSNFVNHPPHRPLSHHAHLQSNNHQFNAMMDTTQHHHHHHCSTSAPGLVPPPEQNLLTPNSDDDIPFRAASAGGQSDLDSCYETMGDEGCSSTSTSVASHCMSASSTGSSMNTSGSSSCSGGPGMMENSSPVAIASTTTDHNLHPMPMEHSDCQHHHHHHQHDIGVYPQPSSCMQSHHHHVNVSSMHHQAMEMLEIPNSTVALCTNNVDDLDDSSSDSDSVELHNVISAVVENSSIETPENTMMGDEGMPDGQMDLQDSQNVISTTTNEPEDQDHDNIDDDDDDDNCSESSMSHINSSFTADMFNDNSMSNQNRDGMDGDSEDFPCIDEGNFIDDDDEDHNLDCDIVREPATTSVDIHLSNSSSESPCSTSPQKILKRSFSEADKDNLTMNTAAPTSSSVSSLSCSSVGSISTFTFGASFRMKSGSGESNSSSSGGGGGVVSASQISNDNDQLNNNINDISNIDKCEDKSVNDSVKVNSVSDNISNPGNDGGDNNGKSVGLRRKGTGGCKALADIISSSSVTGENGNQVSIPKGWKREILKGTQGNENGTNGTVVLYISPSDTKIRNLDELKNYIGSDGTCKCGLSCPLRLEVAFSFDPKVTNMTTAEDEKENLKSTIPVPAPSDSASAPAPSSKEFGERNDSSTTSSTSSSSSPTADPSGVVNTNTAESQDTRLLCNHKRKIPKAEDSPLISSTRDDLGDFGEKSKKRRLSGNECTSGEKLVSCDGPFKKDPITTSASSGNNEPGGNSGSNCGSGSTNNNNNTTASNSSSSHNVPVPFCQQSPDTTTQTPQTEMSPASSVSSDTSSTILFNSAGSVSSGNRSLTSTPTPTLPSSSGTSIASSAPASSSQKIGSSPSQGPGEFVWPSAPPPTLLPQPATSPQIWLNPVPFSSGSNSLTLNYVQTPSSSSTGSPIITTVSPSTAAISSSSVPTTSTATPTTSAGPVPASTTTKKTYPHPYPSKSVKRPSSPCPNIDVSKLPLEQNRPPLVLPTSTVAKISPSPAPILPTLGPSSITSTLPTLSTVVSNPNFLFTVTPPLVAASSTPTLPILPLLTTTGKLPTVGSIDTSCGAPTILTTLQQGTSLFGPITGDASLAGASLLPTVTSIVPSSGPLPPIQISQKPPTKVESNLSKKNDETPGAPTKEIGKSPNKDGKEPPQKVSSSGEAAKSPLQLAQDIISRFEKKPEEKEKESARKTGKLGDSSKESKSEKTLPVIKPAKPIAKEQNDAKQDEKSKSKEESTPNSTSTFSSPKDQNKAEKEKEVVKSESTNAATKENVEIAKTAVVTTATSESGKVGSVSNGKEATPSEVKPKVPVDTTNKTPQSLCMTPTLIVSSAGCITTPTVGSTTTQITSQIPQQLSENTIITSQTPVMSTTPLILKDGLLTDQGLTLTTSVSGPIPTISLSAVGNQIIQTSGGPVSCAPTIQTFSQINNGANQFILQAPPGPHGTTDQNSTTNSTFLTTSGPPRFTTGPILQTIQPFFLNSGHAGGPLIFSQSTPSAQDPTQQQSFIYDQNGTPTATIDANGTLQQIVQPATTTMVLDPSSLCGGNPNLNSMAGAKKKKKRLSKKQQQQQAQNLLQQQFILQQIQAQQQAAAAAAIAPLTIFPQSFNLGPQGFIQPTMNFFPTPTILTLPNLILNPADGTLFIQPSTPLPTAAPAQMQQTTTMKLGQFPLQTTTTIPASPNNPQNIAPKKDSGTGSPLIQEPLKTSSTPGLDPGSDDSRQNPTPDSSTNDLQLGLINVATTPQPNTITLNIPAQNTTTMIHNPSPMVQKKNSKSRAVTSSSANVKRILPQKQILPKIDSTTPSTTENA